MEFCEGDVIARPGNQRDPYGTVVYADPEGGYLIQLRNPGPKVGGRGAGGQIWRDTVHKASLEGFVAIPSMVRAVDGSIRTDPASLQYRQRSNYRLGVREVTSAQVDRALGIAPEDDWGAGDWG